MKNAAAAATQRNWRRVIGTLLSSTKQLLELTLNQSKNIKLQLKYKNK